MSKDIKALSERVERVRMDVQAYGDKLLAILEILMANFDDIRREVRENSDVVDSVIILLKNLREQVANAGTDPAAIQEIVTALDQKTAALAAAVAENTPSAPPAVPADPVVSTPSEPAPSEPVAETPVDPGIPSEPEPVPPSEEPPAGSQNQF